jgi:hypothetical protein
VYRDFSSVLTTIRSFFLGNQLVDDRKAGDPNPLQPRPRSIDSREFVADVTVDPPQSGNEINRLASKAEKQRYVTQLDKSRDEVRSRACLSMIGGGRIFVPETSGNSAPANDQYLSYIQHFYHFESSSGLFLDQVHALQSLRDVARAVVDRVHSKIWGSPADEIAVSLASWISEDPELLESVIAARETWFERSRRGELAASLARKDFWPELKDMAKVCAPPKRDW